MENPFRIASTITGPYFTDRETEVKKMVAVLREPQAKLIVYGPRRMGKSSAMEVAARQTETRHKVPVIFADVSTVSGEADIATRVMQGAIRAFGTKWQDTLKQFATRVSAKLNISVDPVTGLPAVGIEPALRDAPEAAQSQNLGEVLDTIDVRERFALGKTSGTTAKAISRLVELEYLVKIDTMSSDGGAAYVFDSPFFARWVSTRTLQDVGVGPSSLLP